MKSIYVALTCPSCGYQTHKQSETLVIADFEPYLKQQLLDGSFFTARCPSCAQRLQFLHTCLLAGEGYSYIILIKPKQQQKESDHLLYRERSCPKRYVFDSDQLKEQLRILEDGLDDRAIQLLKVKLYLHLKRQGRKISALSYFDLDRSSATIWFHLYADGVREELALAWEAYEALTLTLPKEDALRFQCIDMAWAAAYIKQKTVQGGEK